MNTELLICNQKPIALPVDAPEWWQILPYGQFFIIGDNQPKILDDEAAWLVISRFKKHGRDLVIDYEHQTLKDVQAPAAGWIKEFDWRGTDGLWVRTEWTAKGAAYIVAKEYRYYSPVFYTRKTDGKVVAILNVALTNEPKLIDLMPIAAKMDFNEGVDRAQNPFNAVQAEVNKLFDLSEEDYKKYGPKEKPQSVSKEIDHHAQMEINKMFDLSEEDYEKYGPKEKPQSVSKEIDHHTQMEINKMFDLSEEDYKKYRPKN